jgi:ribosomal-protein-alanine N-acetyltransferase
MVKKIEIETERLYLETLTEELCNQNYLSWFSDKEVNKYLESAEKQTIDTLKAFVRGKNNEEGFFLSIKIKGNGKHIGNVKVDTYYPQHGTAEFGILIGDKHEWDKGYARETSVAIIDYCFNVFNIRKITLGVAEDNLRAVELYIHIGFEIEGVYKKHRFYDGEYRNIIRMGLFNKNFMEIKC